ncbi:MULTISPECIES: ABC transporter substrate-binding protein [unclassified Streptomyces]|uniref:ABC transporter substrate-binding protein n=1 Tax=unclassified Streptomyces TaxID=2593676 RepID=UPI003D8BA8F6
MRRILPTALVLATALAAAACGAPGSSSKTTAPRQTTSAAPRAKTPLPNVPGKVTIGSADFPESELLAHLYAGAMTARKVAVQIHANIGERAAYVSALKEGSIGAVPEYTGAILNYLAPEQKATSPQDIYAQLQRSAQAQDLTVTNYAPAQDADTITVTKATAHKYHLRSIEDLQHVAGRFRLGAPQPLLTVPYGVPGLKKVYGVSFKQFVALAPTGTITQTALRNGTVDAADIFSTDPAIPRYGFVSLKDPQNLFAAQNVVPLFKKDVLTQPMADACNAVSAKLTTAALGELDAQVAQGADPDIVAHKWLSSNGLA